MKHIILGLFVATAIAMSPPVQSQAQSPPAAPACTPAHAAMGQCALPDAPVQSHGQHDPASSGCTPEHAAMGHCTLPEAPKASHGQHQLPDATGCTPEHAAMGHCTLTDAPVQARGQPEPASSGCTPEHAAMGHCTLPEAPKASHGQPPQSTATRCTPEHAAMGHCTLPDAPVQARGQPEPASSGCTPEHAAMGHCRMEAPREPRTPIPVPTEADIAAAFPALHHHAMEHASPVNYMVLFDRLEAWDADEGSGRGWEAIAWIGTDLNRLWLRSEGERESGRTGAFDVEVLYGHSVLPWWDVVAGVRQEVRPRSRTWAAFGVQGLAPYMFEVSATAYVGSGGQVQVKAEAEYDMRFTNRLILQPVFEATVALKDEPMEGIGSGLGGIEAGLRLRYEISRRFAPYIGVVHERAYGNTADYLRASGGHARDTRMVAGVRLWF